MVSMVDTTGKSRDEVLKIREGFVEQYIGDFDKSVSYKTQLKILDRRIATLWYKNKKQEI